MAYINGNGISFNRGNLSGFLKSILASKWDSVLEKGLFKDSSGNQVKYNLLTTQSGPFEKIDFQKNPNATIKDIEVILQKVTNSY